ncbi:hypothetical protein [Streptomyces sp. NPDC047928]|uniref:hypothetical protein n=1 Tax=unclassified Streptomyces TaxID=2593676 RepID=UPI00371A37A1
MNTTPWHDSRDELGTQASRLRDRLNGYRRDVGHLPEHPERVHDAWAKFLEASDTATDALDAWNRIEAEAQQAERSRVAEHRAHLRGDGPKPKPYKPQDAAARRADELLRCSALVDLALEAMGTYSQLLEDRTVMEEARAALVAKFDGLQAQAREAMASAEAAFSDWGTTSDHLGQITAALGLGGGPTGVVPRIDNERFRWFSEAQDAWPVLNRVLGTNDPVASGRWATMTVEELTATPPVWQRERLARNHPGSQDRRDLRRIELRERAAGRLVSALEVPADMTAAEARDLLPAA